MRILNLLIPVGYGYLRIFLEPGDCVLTGTRFYENKTHFVLESSLYNFIEDKFLHYFRM